jgi:4'-phosphopantetheinyl transferase
MRLSPATVEVWRVRTAAIDPRPLETVLADEERVRAARLVDDVHRTRFVVTRAALRRILCAYTGGDPAAVELRYGASGKPYLEGGGAAHALRFSVSHAGDLALLAFALDRDIGIDVERARPPRRPGRIAARLFDGATRRLLEGLPPAERTLAFHHAWTQREAYVKAVGGTVFRTHDPLRLHWPRPEREVHRVPGGAVWTTAALRPAAGYIATLVVAGEPGPIVERDGDADLTDGT